MMRISFAVALLIASSPSLAETSVDKPLRMPGLWQMTAVVSGIPDTVRNFHFCVVPDADQPLAHPSVSVPDCPEQSWRQDRLTKNLTASCADDSGTVAMRGVFGGDFQYNFQGDLTLQYDPPRDGLSEVTISYEGRRLAPCKDTLKRGVFLIQGQDGIGNLNLSQ
jgi:hypothetical protein